MHRAALIDLGIGFWLNQEFSPAFRGNSLPTQYLNLMLICLDLTLKVIFSGFADREHKTTKGIGFEVQNNCFMKTKFCVFVNENHKRPSC